MRLLLTVTCHDNGGFTGRGGHYYSLITIAEALTKEGIDCHILVLGRSHSEVVRKSTLPHSYIFFNGVSLGKVRKEISTLVGEKEIDQIHAFDFASYIICARFKGGKRIPKVLTKCGGKTPEGLYPIPSSMILFSEENRQEFQKKRGYRDTKFYVIPNRVRRFSLDKERTTLFKNKFKVGNEDFVVMRIARLAPEYERGIHQTLQLAEELRNSGLIDGKVRSVIIGKNQNKNSYLSIEKSLKKDDLLITDDSFTYDSKVFLEIADLVVATGRGVMEATSLGKTIFVPVENSEFCVLLNENNFQKLLHFNFSQRNNCQITLESLQENLNTLSDNSNEEFSRKIFEEFFSVDFIWKKYERVYQESSSRRISLKNQLLCEVMLVLGNFKKMYLKN